MMAFYKLFKVIHRRTDFDRLASDLTDAFEQTYYPEVYAEKHKSNGALNRFLMLGTILRGISNNTPY